MKVSDDLIALRFVTRVVVEIPAIWTVSLASDLPLDDALEHVVIIRVQRTEGI